VVCVFASNLMPKNFGPVVFQTAGAIAAMMTMLTSPAFANSSASADIAAPLRAAQAAKRSALGNGDAEFSQIFASWQSLDTGSALGGGAFMRHTSNSGSIPSLIPVQSSRFSSGFGMRWHPVTGGRHEHKGIDLASPIGTPVHASGDGVVGRADWFSSYGLYVQIEHGGELETRYGHMSRLNVAAGQFVHRGDVIGYIGTTGRSTGPHLHYEVRVNGVAVNPLPYMQGEGSAQLASAAAADALTSGTSAIGKTLADAGDE
jgi:murein DD-endopeptidase MepM/ murein hydrolase activator NlpD